MYTKIEGTGLSRQKIDRLRRLRNEVIILPTLLKSLSVSAEDEAIVRKSTAMSERRGKQPTPKSLHQAIGPFLKCYIGDGSWMVQTNTVPVCLVEQ